MEEIQPNKKFLEYKKEFAALCSQCASQQRISFQTDPLCPDTPEVAERYFVDELYKWVRFHAGNPDAQLPRSPQNLTDKRKEVILEIVESYRHELFLPEQIVNEYIKVVREHWKNRYNPTEND